MNMHKNAEKSVGSCDNCKKIVNTIYLCAPYKYLHGYIDNILQEFCTECGKVIAIPHQCAKQLKKYRKKNCIGSNMKGMIKQLERISLMLEKDIDKVKREKGKGNKK